MTWNSALGRRLARLPGRCTACGGYLATQGHHGHCPLGPRAIVTLDRAGRPILRPVPAAEKQTAASLAPTMAPGEPIYAGKLPTTCRACGAYPYANGGGHNARCPREGVR